MLYTLFKRLLVFSSFLLVTMAVQSQQVTKDQLLNLFFQANTALNNNQTEAAVEFYNKILSLGRIPLNVLEENLENSYKVKPIESFFNMTYF